MKKAVIISLGAVFLPLVAQAQQLDELTGLTQSVGNIINLLIPIVFALAILYFFWGLAQFILAAGGDGADEGKSKMLWGIVAIAVMASIWGLVAFLQTNVGIDPTAAPAVDPLIPKP